MFDLATCMENISISTWNSDTEYTLLITLNLPYQFPWSFVLSQKKQPLKAAFQKPFKQAFKRLQSAPQCFVNSLNALCHALSILISSPTLTRFPFTLRQVSGLFLFLALFVFLLCYLIVFMFTHLIVRFFSIGARRCVKKHGSDTLRIWDRSTL